VDTKSLVDKLASTDELQNWGDIAAGVTGVDRTVAFELAVPLWTKRMVEEWKLLLHPIVIEQLQKQEWRPTELQKKMIWASIVCKLDSPDQKAEKAKIRKLLQKRYSNEWWEDVYQRAGKVWPAWDRARKRVFSNGPVITVLAAHSTLIGQALYDEFKAALLMIPSA
jgi:hypothetical protein